MNFPRSAKILRNQFDVAPFATVLFCLLLLLLLGFWLPVPGLRVSLQPPVAADLPGVNGAVIALAVDSQGRLYFENQIVTEPQLKIALADAVKKFPAPPTLILHADKTVSYGQLARLALLAREPQIGITNLLLATLPEPSSAPRRP